MKYRCGIATALVVAFSFGHADAQPIVYVDDSAPPGGNGSSWETAYQSLVTAIGTGLPEIRVAAGTYAPGTPTDTPNVSFNINSGQTIRGGFAGHGWKNPDEQNPEIYKTELTGDLKGDDIGWNNISDNCWHVVQLNSYPCTLEGLTITKGNATIFAVNNSGAGVWISQSGTTTLKQCKIVKNRAVGFAGGIHITGNVTMDECVIADNIAFGRGGGIYASGSATLKNCRILRNATASDGGGVAISGAPSALFANCLFEDNSASTSGGAVHLTNMSLASIEFANCTFVKNSSPTGNLVFAQSMSTFALMGCIGWDNGVNSISTSSAQHVVLYSDIQGGYSGVGNINADPFFVDPANGNFQLTANSPCIDAGNDDKIVAGLPDLNGCPRIQGKSADMGAYEFGDCTPPPPPPPPFGDLNFDGEVDHDDIEVLLNVIGSCNGDNTFNGVINVDDLLNVINGWGACP
jgi:predicted outer membrane repeat protein